MQSIILRTASPVLIALQVLLALWLFLRGHNQPGGGFVGGLVSASAMVLYTIAFGAEAAKKALRFEPRALIAWGLLVALSSGMLALFAGQNFFDGQWLVLHLAGSTIKLGSPVLFDIGVFMVVQGVVLMMIFALDTSDDIVDMVDAIERVTEQTLTAETVAEETA